MSSGDTFQGRHRVIDSASFTGHHSSRAPAPLRASMPQRAPVPLMAPVLQRQSQGRRNHFEVGGGGGQTSPGIQGNPYPKLKTPRIWPIIFGRAPSSRAKNKQKIKNEPQVDSRKLGGGPTASKFMKASCPTLPPAPASPGQSCWRADRATEGSWAALGTRDSESVAEGARPPRVSFC